MLLDSVQNGPNWEGIWYLEYVLVSLNDSFIFVMNVGQTIICERFLQHEIQEKQKITHRRDQALYCPFMKFSP